MQSKISGQTHKLKQQEAFDFSEQYFNQQEQQEQIGVIKDLAGQAINQSLTLAKPNPLGKPRLDQYYRIESFINQGSQARVYLCNSTDSTDNKQYVLKHYKLKSQGQYEVILQEIKYLQDLRICQNIIQLKSVYLSERSLYMIIDYAEQGDLNQQIRQGMKFDEEQLKIIMIQLLLAIDLTHKFSIIHRDLKPENILLMNQETLEIQISDFGLSCNNDDFKRKTQYCGTPGYIAPEIIQGNEFDYKSDIFSLGSVMYFLIKGRCFFKGINSRERLIDNLRRDPKKIYKSLSGIVSEEGIKLLVQMLSVNPNTRPTAEECLKCLILNRRSQNNHLLSNNQQTDDLKINYNKIVRTYRQGKNQIYQNMSSLISTSPLLNGTQTAELAPSDSVIQSRKNKSKQYQITNDLSKNNLEFTFKKYSNNIDPVEVPEIIKKPEVFDEQEGNVSIDYYDDDKKFLNNMDRLAINEIQDDDRLMCLKNQTRCFRIFI
ncbi:serine threonine protein kinase [Stylonychia lemnae]|uniref:Serine threonine protein kinase n=1 Tax=Stylonychia lemnae TaxID=5949 RepID=A0A077ZSN4_STYLE|nr:serine threonine protein kinase [Stylonychia lemnae]|eukprot:CDW72893.1 serine threonine protein kinase [Stylonychia lemnae]